MVFHIQINPSGEETLIASLIHLSVIYHLPVYHLSVYLSPIYLLSIIYLPIISIYHLSIYIYIYLSVYQSLDLATLSWALGIFTFSISSTACKMRVRVVSPVAEWKAGGTFHCELILTL